MKSIHILTSVTLMLLASCTVGRTTRAPVKPYAKLYYNEKGHMMDKTDYLTLESDSMYVGYTVEQNEYLEHKVIRKERIIELEASYLNLLKEYITTITEGRIKLDKTLVILYKNCIHDFRTQLYTSEYLDAWKLMDIDSDIMTMTTSFIDDVRLRIHKYGLYNDRLMMLSDLLFKDARIPNNIIVIRPDGLLYVVVDETSLDHAKEMVNSKWIIESRSGKIIPN